MALAQSMTLPPPNPITKSQPAARARAVAVAMTGGLVTSSTKARAGCSLVASQTS